MIYLVEDNDGIRETVRAYLELAGFSVEEFPRAAGVVEALSFRSPDLCILDVMLPDGNGFSLAKKIRETCPDVAFIFLTARESESDRITGLELGAEDYIVKPFSPRELVLRVQNIVRRVAPDRGTDGKLTARQWLADGHSLKIDGASHDVFLDGVSVHLTAVEWNILSYLSDNAGVLVSRERILGECLDYAHDGSDRAVNTHLKNIRAKLGDAEWIETVRGFGYKFVGKLAGGVKRT
jgi:two-component system phosphate regulon response regulator PhoB